MACVSIHRLATDEIDEAWVLARLSDADLTLEDWRAKMALRSASPHAGGILLARDLEARPCGLVVYALTDQPNRQRSLQIETLIGFDMLDPRAVASTLIVEVVRLARATGCESLCLIRPLGLSLDVATEVLASGVAVLPSLFWSAPPVQPANAPIDLRQGRHPPGLVN